jgi:RNA methyltransferase, TrmH family
MTDAGPGLIERFREARADPQRAVLEGFHPLKHAVRLEAAVELAVAPSATALAMLALHLAPELGPWLVNHVTPVAPAIFRQLAPSEPEVLAIARRPKVEVGRLLAGGGQAPLVLLEKPSHLGNLGAAVRVAAAAGAAGVLTTGRLDPWHPAALRGAAGLHYALPVARIGELPPTPRPVIALDPAGEPLHPDSLPAGAILAFGSERRGLSLELRTRAGQCLALPMRPGISSLNLATAVAAVLYAWRLGRSD